MDKAVSSLVNFMRLLTVNASYTDASLSALQWCFCHSGDRASAEQSISCLSVCCKCGSWMMVQCCHRLHWFVLYGAVTRGDQEFHGLQLSEVDLSSNALTGTLPSSWDQLKLVSMSYASVHAVILLAPSQACT